MRAELAIAFLAGVLVGTACFGVPFAVLVFRIALTGRPMQSFARGPDA